MDDSDEEDWMDTDEDDDQVMAWSGFAHATSPAPVTATATASTPRPMATNKRLRHAPPVERGLRVAPAFCGPYADRFLQTAWWTQSIPTS